MNRMNAATASSLDVTRRLLLPLLLDGGNSSFDRSFSAMTLGKAFSRI
jgi:hypothetical protein